ncbi:protein containing Prepilin-type cleavage/methylation, N-terminal domain [Sulfurimonas gotlandica GD1]|uniref:Protein containing Prepilin-type cleavage/methylation, N-terminal domain n=1 Tax=Sulfurimonas gotlandica (strain DSM 19862 / JCM 16533 / GD1) TaxID=929558 RepID=B6BIV5_SULGG|nr:type II secretion system protein [Sulfurimonas gotlandica]EDZ63243.1 N-terminal methylation protein [Sulfurimonas gotlandica GD1]EHP30465.1 protein containing Prepilin-type cleavage/methylation, N-terminal domain [Sulfurimonas gotlandica GD1]
MKKAFTMIELVFVLVVIGILAAVMIPGMKSTKLREAAIQVVSHIRYTQHLAMIDDKFDSTDADWYKSRWHILFGSSADTENKIAYSIFSDKDSLAGTAPDGKPNLTNNEIAFNPENTDKYLSGGYSGILTSSDSRATKNMNLGLSYGLNDLNGVVFNGGCASATIKRLTFDHLGRPIQGTLNGFTKSYETNKLIQTRCEIVLSSPEGSVTIAIEPETGYAHILDS